MLKEFDGYADHIGVLVIQYDWNPVPPNGFPTLEPLWVGFTHIDIDACVGCAPLLGKPETKFSPTMSDAPLKCIAPPIIPGTPIVGVVGLAPPCQSDQVAGTIMPPPEYVFAIDETT